MIIHDKVEQYTPEWWSLRRGLPTASRADKITTPTGKYSTQSRAYAHELIASEVMGNEDESKIEASEWMLRGLELEGEARDWFGLKLGNEVHEIGFITDNDNTRGCSPDGAIWTGPGQLECTVEIKCPMGKTHVGYLLAGVLPTFYGPQVHMTMSITGKPAVFISYHPSFKPLVVTVEPDEYTEMIGKALDKFVVEIAEMRELLK